MTRRKKCIFCVNYKECVEKKTLLSSKVDTAFTTVGFNNWKHALNKFSLHEKSSCHREAVEKVLVSNSGLNLSNQLVAAKKQEMITARNALKVIFTSLLFLARQEIAIRGHEEHESNFYQLLQCRAEESGPIASWLKGSQKFKWMSPIIQNEILEIMANDVLRSVVTNIKNSVYFSLIMDETSDLSRQEQVSISFRYVDQDSELKVNEAFVGFYQSNSLTSETLFLILEDTLKRFDLCFEHCRGQCYDGANNVAGKFSGVQQRVKERQPLAVFVHCSAHCLNLSVQDAMQHVSMVRDTMNSIKDMVNFVKESPLRITSFRSFQSDDAKELRPLCPTRWLMRVSSVQSVQQNYNYLMEFFENSAESDTSKPDFASKCTGFLNQMHRFQFFFSLKVIIKVLGPVEEVNREIQSPKMSLRSVEKKLELLTELLSSFRQEDVFHCLWTEAESEAKELKLDEPNFPRPRRCPRRFDDGCEAHIFETPEDYFRKGYIEVVDTILETITERYKKTTAFVGLRKIEEYVVKFLASESNESLTVNKIKGLFELLFRDDFQVNRLKLHLAMLKDICTSRKTTVANFSELKQLLIVDKSLASSLTEVTKLVRLFYTVPVTTCTAERSFSMMRRLKNYLRTTTNQKRLNHLAILCTYKEEVDKLNICKLVNDFVKVTTQRQNVFALY